MNKKTIFIIAGVIAAIAAFLLLTKPASQTNAEPTNHQYSQGSSGIVLMEYGDFECPGCGAYYPLIKQLKEIYKETITFQFRHLPLEQIHVNARAAARAAEAADKQGKFWEMHDMLFETQQSWKSVGDPVSIFGSYADQLGLNVDQFKTDYVSSDTNARINADLAEFGKTGEPKSTPTFFLDGKRIDPDGTYEGFVQILNEALQAKNITPPEVPGSTEPAAESTNPNGMGSTEEQPQQ